jgi:two-component SAPR family response regulator
LVITKVVLHDDNSNDFIARLQLVCPQVCALFVTDASAAELADKQRSPCERAFLQKPFRASALADTIRGLLDGLERQAASVV